MSAQRVVIVTGGASGIGLGIGKRFAANGHAVAMLDVQDEALARESTALTASGAKVLALKVDVSNREQVDAAYATVRKHLGAISVVIANAGISTPQSVLSMSVSDWQRMIDVNLTGVFHTIQAALPDMVQHKWGRIVTMADIQIHSCADGAIRS